VPPTIDDVVAAAQAFKTMLQARVKAPPDDRRSCKELLAGGGVQHQHNKLLIQAAEIIDDFLLATAALPHDGGR
jgi:hypothetical protein